MSTKTIELAYDGEAVQSGSMDVRELGPALIAIGALFHGANEALNQDRVAVSVNVKSEFKQGSFEITLLLEALELAQGMLATLGQVRDAKELVDLVGLSLSANAAGVEITSLLGFLRALAGRPYEVVARDQAQNNVTVNVEGDQYVINADVVNLHQAPKVRDALDKTLEPIRRDGIDKFIVKDGPLRSEISKKEAEFFRTGAAPLESEDLVPATERTVPLQVVKVSFDPGLRWTFTDGESRFGAIVKDKEFTELVRSGQIGFKNGDTLIVRMSSSYRLVDGTLKAEHVVLDVQKHIPRWEQPRLL